jgi:hypothetical protein
MTKLFAGTIMRTPRNDCPMRFNVWNVQGTWFWSLVYPDQHGGAIGAAASEPEAVGEARAAIERFAKLSCDTEIALESRNFPGPRELQSSKDLKLRIDGKVARATCDFGCSRAARSRSSRIPAMGESYNNLWQLTLAHYAARVAAA